MSGTENPDPLPANPEMIGTRMAAYQLAMKLIREGGSSPYRDWLLVERLADWLLRVAREGEAS